MFLSVALDITNLLQKAAAFVRQPFRLINKLRTR